MKELKDYMHLYFGCRVQYEGILNGEELKKERKENEGDCFFIPKVKEVRGVKIGILKSIETNVSNSTIKCRIGRKGLQTHYGNGNFKLILRPLSDITDEEKKRIGFDAYKVLRGSNSLPAFSESKVWAAEQTAFLLSKHFDLFGLIEAGLAIDATKVKDNQS